MDSGFKHKIKYIDWYEEAEFHNVNQKEFTDKFQEIKDNGGVKSASATKRADFVFHDYTYQIYNKGHWRFLRYFNKRKFYCYSTNTFDDNKNKGKITNDGKKAVKLVSDKFKEINKIGLKQAFGYSPEEYRRCVPKQLYFTNKMYFNKELKCVSSVDYNSHYPNNICGSLPDYHTAVEYKGTVKPTAEYPFAMYIKSGYIAEYGKYDSHEWYKDYEIAPYVYNVNVDKQHEYAKQNPALNPKDDITILMKASKYRLEDVYRYYYEEKKKQPKDTDEYADAKLVLNASIGYFHTVMYKNYQMAHIAAFCIARANDRIIRKAREIGWFKIIQLCVDGIIYVGDKEYGIKSKELGDLDQEFTGWKGIITSINRYIFTDGNGNWKVKTQGCDINADGSRIDAKNIKDVKEIYNWKLKPKMEDIENGEKKE